MPMTRRIRSSQRSALRLGGGVACGGSGPQPSLGASMAGGQIPIACTHTEVPEAGRANGHFDPPEPAVRCGVGRRVADAVAAADVFRNCLERLDDFFL